MTEINFYTLLAIFMLITFLDKAVTAINIVAVNTNFKELVKSNPYSIEKAPLAHWFFVKLGLLWGSVVYWFISVGTLFIAYYGLRFALSAIPYTAGEISLYIIILAYGLVLTNNFYFLLRYTKII